MTGLPPEQRSIYKRSIYKRSIEPRPEGAGYVIF